MRKFINLLLVLILITGCSTKNVEVKDQNLYEIQKDFTYIENIEGFNTKKIDIYNYSKLKFDSNYTYGFYETDDKIFYQEFTNYLNLFQNMFDEKVKFYHYKEMQQWKVEITYEDKTKSNVTFDFNKNNVTLSSIDALESMFKNDTEAEEVFKQSEKLYKEEVFKQVNEPKSIVLDLSKYNLEMKKVGENYLVPSYLLQFVLSAYDNKLFYNGTSFDYFNLMFQNSEGTDNSIAYTAELIDYATRFNLMIFDNFYGLKEYKGDYLQRLSNTNVLGNYANNFTDYIVSLDDNHTNVINYSFGDYDGYATPKLWESYQKEVAYEEKVGCSDDKNTFEQEKLSEDTLYVAVNSLAESSFADEYLKTINSTTTENYKNIVIDLRCNVGGYVFNAAVLLYPFTNENINVNYCDITGGKSSTTYVKKNNKEKIVKSNVYVLTSDLTFSAANEATMLFKEYGIGTIIGEKSGGGAATISSYNSPSGAYLVMSSGQMLCTEKEGHVIEDGIDVHYGFDVNKDTYKQEVLRVIDTNK